MLSGKTVYLTGAASGIGRAAALAFAAAGARLMIVDIDTDGLAETADRVRSTGGTVETRRTDVTDRADVAAALAETVARFGGLDCAINNAGIAGPPGDILDLPDADARRIMAVNFWGVFNGMVEQIAVMLPRGGGTIVNTASGAGLVATPQYSMYCASKHGVVGLTRSIGVEYAGRGIRVNSVCPGFTETPQTDPQRSTQAARAAVDAAHPIGRVAEASEIANALLWLASPASSYVTATNLVIDGGYTAQ